jgi:hypothetical protein
MTRIIKQIIHYLLEIIIHLGFDLILDYLRQIIENLR